MVSPDYLAGDGHAGREGPRHRRGPTGWFAARAGRERDLREARVSGQDAVGRRIDWNDDTWEIAGVTVDVRHAALGDALDADVYVPRTQVVRGNTWLLIKTAPSGGRRPRRAAGAGEGNRSGRRAHRRGDDAAAPGGEHRARTLPGDRHRHAGRPDPAARNRRPARRRLVRGGATHPRDRRPPRAGAAARRGRASVSSATRCARSPREPSLASSPRCMPAAGCRRSSPCTPTCRRRWPRWWRSSSPRRSWLPPVPRGGRAVWTRSWLCGCRGAVPRSGRRI